MPTRHVVALCALSLLLGADLAAAQTRAKVDLTGNWIAEVSMAGVANSPTRYFSFTLAQSGADLTGTLAARPARCSWRHCPHVDRRCAGKDSNGVQRSAGGNPQTGPFYVEGALPGDTTWSSRRT